MIKKIISTVLSFLLLFLMVTPAMAVTENGFSYPNNSEYCFSESVTIDGEDVIFYHYTVDGFFYIRYEKNNQTVIVERNNLNGIIKMNDEYVGTALTRSPQEFRFEEFNGASLFASRAKGSWEKYDTDYGDITSSILDTASWAAVIAAALGIAVKPLINSPLIAKIVESALPTIYFRQDKYYWDPIITQRPKTASNYLFYKDKGRKEYLGNYDTRY